MKFSKLIIILLAILGAFALGKIISEPFQYFKESANEYSTVYFVIVTSIMLIAIYSIIDTIIDTIDGN